jgi:hypothetical protein
LNVLQESTLEPCAPPRAPTNASNSWDNTLSRLVVRGVERDHGASVLQAASVTRMGRRVLVRKDLLLKGA